MTTTAMMASRSSSSTVSFSSFFKSQNKQLLMCPTTVVIRRNSKAFLVHATANGSKGKRMMNSDVVMVDPLEAKQLAVKQMEEIQVKERLKKLRRIEAINGAWAVIGLTVGLVIEDRTGNSIPQQLTGYWTTITGFFASGMLKSG